MDNNNDTSTLYYQRDKSINNNPITVIKKTGSKRGNYLFGETIGQGAFAKVKLATHIYTQEKVAIKILDKSQFIDNEKDIYRIQKEINILKRLKHKNIIQLFEIMESETTLYIVMDYCEGKELFDFIIKRKQLTEREACRFFQQIINGVEYLHLQNITHRDLKPENLLLDNKKRIKISDFGLSSFIENDNRLLQTPCGTPSYAPPEMLRGDAYNGSKSDIWSCGIILYTMLCGNLPCVESKEELIYQCLCNKDYDYPNFLSSSAVDLMERLLQFNPDERLNFEQIKSHPWFNLIRSQMKPGIILGVHKIPIDEQILNKVEMFGYDKEKCRESVLLNKYDQLCSIYYLVMKQFSREGKQSISDMSSEEYENYIQSVLNWENRELLKEYKYKDYWSEKGFNNSYYKQNFSPNLSSNNYNSQTHYMKYDMNNQTATGKNTNLIEIIDCNVKQYLRDETNKSIKSNASDNTIVNILNHFPTKTYNNSNKSPLKQVTYTSSTRKDHRKASYFHNSHQHKLDPNNAYKTNTFSQDNNSKDLIKNLDEGKKQLLLEKLMSKQLSYDNDIKHIDSMNQNSDNIIALMAKKLIKTTIFGKYILNKKVKKAYKDELEEKFYTLQKYKDLVEIIKSKRGGIFPKKIYDWNYYTFDVFLDNKEDYIFSDIFIKNNINSGFIEMINKGIKQVKVRNRQRFLSKNIMSSRNSMGSYFQSGQSSPGRIYWNSNNKNRLNRFNIVPTSIFIQDKSLDRSGYQSSNENKKKHRKNIKEKPHLQSKYSSSTMNNISEDEELIQKQTLNIKPIPVNKVNKKRITIAKSQEPYQISDHKKNNRGSRIQTDTNQQSYFIDIMRPTDFHIETSLMDIFTEQNQTVSSINTSQTQASLKMHSIVNNISNNKPDNYPISRNINRNNENNNLNQLKTSTSLRQDKPFSLFPRMNDFKSNEEKEYADGPIDFRCVFQSSKDSLLPIIKQYFKQNEYFCNAINKKIKCLKANIQIELEILTLKGTTLSYIKVKRNKGEGKEFTRIINGLIDKCSL